MSKKSNSASMLSPSASRLVLQTGYVEVLYARGELNLNKDQIGQISKQQKISLSRRQAAHLEIGNRGSSEKWLAPLDAVHWLAPHVGGDAKAKEAIAERLRDCAVRCSCVWLAEGVDIGEIPTQRPQVSDQLLPGAVLRISPPAPIPNEIGLGGAMFSYSDNWLADVARWQWNSATLITTNRRGAKIEKFDEEGNCEVLFTRLRMVAFGVRFLREDIEKIVAPTALPSGVAAVAAHVPSRGRKGPRQKKYRSESVRVRLQSEIANGVIYERYPQGPKWGVQASLEREIALSFSDPNDSPSESTIRRWAKELMEAWRQIENDR